MTEGKRHHAKTGKTLASHAIETNTAPYWGDYYIARLDAQYRSILGMKETAPAQKPVEKETQMLMELTV